MEWVEAGASGQDEHRLAATAGAALEPSVLDAVFASAGVGLCLIGPDRRVLRANGQWLRTAGFTAEHAIGSDIWDLFPSSSPELRRLYQRVCAGETIDLPPHLQVLSGREIWYEGRLSPVPLLDGTGVLVTALDVTERRRAEEALRVGEARYRAFFDSLTELVLVLEAIRNERGEVVDWLYRDANEALLRHMGLAREQIVGRRGTEVFGAEWIARATPEYARVLASGEPSLRETVLNGVHYLRSLFRMGENTLGLASLDITDRKNAEEALARERARLQLGYELAAALSAARTPADVARVVFDKGLPAFAADAGALALADEQDARFLKLIAQSGYPEELFESWRRLPGTLSTPVTDAYRSGVASWVASVSEGAARFPRWAAAVAHLPDRAWAGVPLRVEGRILGALGLAFRREHAFPLEERAFIESVADRCAQALERARLLDAEREARALAEARAEALRASEERFRRSAEDERRARQAAERIGELQRLVMGVVSHDLRSPLQSIKMCAGLLVQQGGLTQAQAERVLRISRSADRASDIIRDLLDTTRVRQGEMLHVERQRLDLEELCQRLVAEARSIHPDRVIDFVSTGPCLGAFDPTRVGQLVSNLLANALFHGGPAARVAVSLENDGAAVRLSVFNDGPPIPRDDQASIFEPFRRAHAGGPRQSGGVGLGLFIVREIARAHGGYVGVVSDAQHGTTFTVRMPVGE